MASSLDVTGDLQQRINRAAADHRREVIFTLLKIDFADYRLSLPEKEVLAYEIEQIARLHCCTRSLRKMFADAREYRREAGYYPAPATLADLKFVLNERSFGRYCNRVRLGWIADKRDADLRSLPSFIRIVQLIKPFSDAGRPLPGPNNMVTGDAKLLIDAVTDHIRL